MSSERHEGGCSTLISEARPPWQVNLGNAEEFEDEKIGNISCANTRGENCIVASQSRPSQKEIHLSTIDVQGQVVSFREGYLCTHT